MFSFLLSLFSLQKWRCEEPQACTRVHGYENARLQFLSQDRRPWESRKEIQRYVETKPGGVLNRPGL